MAVLTGGALFMDRKRRNGAMHNQMDGFLDILWHGAHDNGEGDDRDIATSVYLANDCRGGQFEIYFCSTACLRAFLNAWVDALESKVGKQRKRSQGMVARGTIKAP